MHARAKRALTRLVEDGAELHVGSYALLETMALLQSRVSLEAALQFERSFGPLLRVTRIDEKLHARSVRRLELRRSRELSLADCSSFVIMEDLGLTEAFAYDPHFAREGFRLIQ
jgi:predicted nucleic acid-binding protein